MIQETILLACLAPVASAALAPSANATAVSGVVWEFENFEASLEGAAKAEKPVLVYFWSNGSQSCAQMYGETMSSDAVVAEMSHYACFSADTASTLGYELLQKYHMTTVPAVVFVTHEGVVNDAVVGYIDPGGFVEELRRVRAGRDTIAAFRERAQGAPDDLELQYAYAVKLQDCGDLDGHDRVTGGIKAADPKGSHPVAARLLMQDLQKSIVEQAANEAGEYDFEHSDLAAVTSFVKKLKHDDVAFEGWTWIAAIEKEREDYPAYRQATMAAWPYVDDEKIRPFSHDVASAFWEAREDLSRQEKKFVLTLATKAVELTERYVAEREAEMIAAGGEGCGSYAGCAAGEGCGGCGGGKAELVAYRTGASDTLACALYVNGKKKDAIAEVRAALSAAPENERLVARLAYFEAGK